jgi:hypothetical protein
MVRPVTSNGLRDRYEYAGLQDFSPPRATLCARQLNVAARASADSQRAKPSLCYSVSPKAPGALHFGQRVCRRQARRS